jgi:hypothetical protein
MVEQYERAGSIRATSRKRTPMPLPLEVTTDAGIVKILLDKEPVLIKSKTLPVVDGKGAYFKRIIIE